MILVVGATGVLGSQIVRTLLSKGEKVRALVRSSTSKATALQEAGAQLIQGDLLDRSSIEKACHGVNAVVTTASAMASQNPQDSFEAIDRDGQIGLVDSAEVAGVNRFVYISSPESPDTSPLQAAKLAVEQRLRSGSMPFVVLRPSFLMEVWLSPALGFDYVEGRVRIYGDGRNPIGWISVADVAEVVGWALTAPEALGKIIDFGGEPLAPNDVLTTFERISGRRFGSESLPEPVLREQYNAALDPRQRTFFAVALQYARGYATDPSSLPATAPEPEIDVGAYAKLVLQRKG
jgi:uncharacterized protein YbjT (DUF2867 family)